MKVDPKKTTVYVVNGRQVDVPPPRVARPVRGWEVAFSVVMWLIGMGFIAGAVLR